MRSEEDPAAARKRAQANERFWRMVFCAGGPSYSELRDMDVYEFVEAEQARLFWQTVWSKQRDI